MPGTGTLLVIIALLCGTLVQGVTLGGDPKFEGKNIAHVAINSQEMKPMEIADFEMRPVGEHSVIFLYKHKIFAKLTANAENFAFAINPKDAPDLGADVIQQRGDFEKDIQSNEDILFTDSPQNRLPHTP